MKKPDVGQRAHQMQKLRSFLLEIPKTEIHLHLEALASVDTIWTLMKRHDISYDDVSSKDDLRKKFQITNFAEFLDLFINVIQNCFRAESDIDLLIDDTQAYLVRNNIVYAEIFFAPSKFVMNGLSFEKMMAHIENGAQKIRKESNIDIRIIVDVSRSFGIENAERNLDLTLGNNTDCIIGIGLGGAEESGPAKDYVSVFERALENGLHVVAHAGEVVGPESVWDAISLLKAERIGHGISSIFDDSLVSHLAETQLPLEINPTSNVFTQKYVKALEEHPIRQLYDRGVYVTVNTDDPTVFGIDLVDEYMKLANRDFFKAHELVQLAKNNVYATFLPQNRKDEIWGVAEALLASYPAEFKA